MKSYELLAQRSKDIRDLDFEITYVLKNHGLEITPNEWTVLGLIHDIPDARVSTIAPIIKTSIEYVTSTVKSLEKKGLVKKSGAKDKRVNTLVFNGDETVFKEVEENLREVL